MPTNEERREVARRLREIRLCKSGHIEWWKIAQAIGLKEPAGWFGWEKFEPDSVKRLADLVEPSCDRDALLKVADMLECNGECSECEYGKVKRTKFTKEFSRGFIEGFNNGLEFMASFNSRDMERGKL